MRTPLLFASIVLLHFAAQAQEFRPYPRPKITETEWKTYFDEVKNKHFSSMQALSDQNLVVFHDRGTGTSYAFTQSGHPAHPAWVTRKIVSQGGQLHIEQVGYFAGDESAFAALFRAYQKTTAKMLEEMKANAGNRKP